MLDSGASAVCFSALRCSPANKKPLLAGPASNSGLVPNRGLSSKPTSGPVNKGLMVLSHLLLFEDSAAMIERVIPKSQAPTFNSALILFCLSLALRFTQSTQAPDEV